MSQLSAGGEGMDLPIDAGPMIGPDASGAVKQLNSLLRGEISAAETYRMAMDRAMSEQASSRTPSLGLLREIQEEHGRAAQALRSRIHSLGGEADQSSGAWGIWAKLAQGTSNLFGNAASMKSLKEGEEHGLKDYSSCSGLDATSMELIENQLIPAQRRHINLLDQLIASASSKQS